MAKHLVLEDLPQVNQNIGNKLEDFEKLQTLGKGGYGFVAKVKSKIDHKLYAMKMIDLSLIKDPTQISLSMNEIKIIQSLDSPHIIKYYNSFQINNRFYIIMEYMNNGDLKGYITAHQSMNNPIPEDELWELFYQCIASLSYIHKNNLIHRDIKPANLFMTDDKAIKIGDFGISASDKKQKQNVEGMSKETLTIGTRSYMSPEMFTQTGYDNKVDVYALGVSFHLMCFYELPRKFVEIDGPNGKSVQLQDIPPKFNTNCYSNDIHNIIKKMIEIDPQKRPTAFEVFDQIKKIYNMKKRQNYSIDNVYRCLFSFQNLTNFMKKNSKFIFETMGQRPISRSFLYAIDNMDKDDWPNHLVILREILTFNNSSFPDPGIIDPIDLVKFILKRMHQERLSNKSTSVSDNPYIFTPNDFSAKRNYQETLKQYFNDFQVHKSCISDYFFGTYEITKVCCNCQSKSFYFQNYFVITFNIDEALKNGISGINGQLSNYFSKQNSLIINNQYFCNFCRCMAFHQESKKFLTLPYNLVICFKGEKQNYDNQYLQYQINLNLANLGLKSSPCNYYLKGVIKSCIVQEKKIYTCIYLDITKNCWVTSDGYSKQLMPNPFNNIGDIVMLFYSSIN